ncbi:Uncharacterised protein [uncultured archaeon]|nr:Uncharacterised protein [uncultured archaeon]
MGGRKIRFKLVENGTNCYRDDEIEISINKIKNISKNLEVPPKIVFWYMLNHEICHAKYNIGMRLINRGINNRRELDNYIRKYRFEELGCLQKPTTDYERKLHKDAIDGLKFQIREWNNTFKQSGTIVVIEKERMT